MCNSEDMNSNEFFMISEVSFLLHVLPVHVILVGECSLVFARFIYYQCYDKTKRRDSSIVARLRFRQCELPEINSVYSSKQITITWALLSHTLIKLLVLDK